MTKTVNLEPNWPAMLRFFEQAARDHKGTAKGRRFQEQADQIRRYLESKEA